MLKSSNENRDLVRDAAFGKSFMRPVSAWQYPAIVCATGSRGDGYPFTMIRNQRKAGFAFALFLIA